MTPENGLTSTQKLVALAWAHRSTYETGAINESNRGKTSIAGVAARCEMKDRAVRMATKELVRKGWMAEEQNPGSVSVYQLVIPTLEPRHLMPITPVLNAVVEDLPRHEMPDTPASDADNKDSKNVTTKNEYKDGARSADAPLASVKIESFEIEVVSDTSSLPVEDTDADLDSQDGVDPGIKDRGAYDDDDEEIEWDTVMPNEAESQLETDDRSDEMKARGEVRQYVRIHAGNKHWSRRKEEQFRESCFAKIGVFQGTLRELVDQVASEWEAGEDW